MTRRRLTVAAALALVFLIIGIFYVKRQLTALPQWYAQEAQSSKPLVFEDIEDSIEEEVERAPMVDAAPPPAQEGAPIIVPGPSSPNSPGAAANAKAKPTARVLRNFHLQTILSQGPIGQAIRGSRLQLTGQQLDAELIIVPDQIDMDELSTQERNVVEKLMSLAPIRKGQPLGLSLRGTAKRTASGYQLGTDARVGLGSTEFSLGSLANRLGGSSQRANDSLSRELTRLLTRKHK